MATCLEYLPEYGSQQRFGRDLPGDRYRLTRFYLDRVIDQGLRPSLESLIGLHHLSGSFVYWSVTFVDSLRTSIRLGQFHQYRLCYTGQTDHAVPATADEGMQPMATLFALIYPDTETAEAAAETAKGLDQAGFLRILDSAVVIKNANGKVEHKGQRNPVRSGGVAGGVVGALTGLMFTVPVLGLAAGAALGAYAGGLFKSGGTGDFNAFKEQVDSDLAPGGSALLVLGDTTGGRERVVQDLGRHGGTLRSTDISDEQVALIQKEIDKASA